MFAKKELPPDCVQREYLAKHNLGSYRMGTMGATPDRILRDKDTSPILVGGAIPPGAPAGTRFDVFVTCLPQTQTRNLDGGHLMPIELRLAYGGVSHPTRITEIRGRATGPIFVNPFIDPSSPSESAKLRIGRIVGGGEVTSSRPARLQLRRADYATADLIQHRINERFRSGPKIANAMNRFVVELKIPREYRDDYQHFLELVMHLPVRFVSGTLEGDAREITALMEMPSANHAELALVCEAMGRQIVPIFQKLYTSKNPAAAFYAARTGMRLEDNLAVEVILRFAKSADSPYQVPAIEELGRHGRIIRGGLALRHLIDDPNERVRVAAYEAMVKRGDRSVVRRIDISEQFKLDLVATRRSYTIYVTQTSEPKIVLFGRDMTVARPIYFESSEELVTANAFSNSKTLTVFRKIPRRGGISEPFQIDFMVRSLVKTLGSQAERGNDGKIMGLGLTYSQVVGVLYRMCKAGDIPAKFVLQEAPGLQRIYQGAATVGRPDMIGL